MTLPIVISFECTDAFLQRSCARYIRRRVGRNLALSYGTFGALMIVSLRMAGTKSLAVYGVISLCLLAILAWALFRGQRQVFRLMQDDRGKHIRFRIDQIGIVRESGSTMLRLSWRAFDRVWRYHDCWLLPVPPASFLAIPTADLDREAQEFIERQVRIGKGGGRCSKCGYDLRGQPSNRCPECGQPFEAELTVISNAAIGLEPQSRDAPTPNDDAVQLTYDLTSDLVACAVRSAISKEAVKSFFICALGGIAALGLLLGWNSLRTSIPYLIAIASGIIGVLAVYLATLDANLKARKRHRDNKVVLLLAPQGVTVESDIGAAAIGWERFTGVKKHRDYWLLMMPGSRVMIVPTTALSEAAREMIQLHVRRRK
jgi:hypothetical protein